MSEEQAIRVSVTGTITEGGWRYTSLLDGVDFVTPVGQRLRLVMTFYDVDEHEFLPGDAILGVDMDLTYEMEPI